MGAYNEAPYLNETIPAVLRQHGPDFKLLLFDNGSTDTTPKICERFQADDDRIVFVRSPKNLRPGAAANMIMPLVRDLWRDCQWFLAAGADDVMERGYLAAILDAADANPHANLIFSPWQWIGHPEKGVKHFPPYDPETFHAVHQIPAWHAQRRELWGLVGPQDEHMTAADWDWLMRASVGGLLRPVQLERPYISLRVRPSSRVTQSEEVHWPSLHRRLCGIAGKPVPEWAMHATKSC